MANSPAIDIGPGDLLDIEVFDTPELSTHVRVTQDGFANLPVIGRIELSGVNADQAARAIEDEFRRRNLLLEPHVTVFITEYASQGATISGEVKQPGIYPTLGKRRMLDMLAIAGGISATGGKTVSIIHRDDPEHPMKVALQANPNNLGAQVNPEIFPGDTIVVAKAGVVYIVGDVAKAGGFLVDNNELLSTAQAISLAGGPNRTASLSKTRLIRKVDGGRQEYTLDIAKLLKGEQADLQLRDGDIIWVPSSQFKTFGYRGIEAAIAITTGLVHLQPLVEFRSQAELAGLARRARSSPSGNWAKAAIICGVFFLKILYLGPNSGTSKQRKEALVRLGHQVTGIDPYALLPENHLIGLWQWRAGAIGLAEIVRRRVLRSLAELGPQ